MTGKKIPKASLIRLPAYLEYLNSLPKGDCEYISSSQIASALKLGEIQVRKDLASVSDGGKPRIGYEKEKLISDLKSFLGYDEIREAVIVGAGKLGKALLYHSEFINYGLNIIAAFDINPDAVTSSNNNKPIFYIDMFSKICRKRNIKLGIITVPAQSAQDVCNMMVENGIRAIWNFATTHLDVPEDILVQNENMASSLAILSGHLTEQLHE